MLFLVDYKFLCMIADTVLTRGVARQIQGGFEVLYVNLTSNF